MMKVGVYFSPWGRTLSPTGVGRHAIEMTSALAARSDIEASRFTTRGDHEKNTQHLPEAIAQMPVRLLPGNETLSRWMLMGLPFWKIDDDAEDLDWVYCTKEQPVATRKCKVAVNVHDALPFERSIAGMPDTSSWRSRFKWDRILSRVRQSDLITTVSEFTRNRLIELFGIPEDRIVVTGNGVTDEYFRGPQPEDVEVLNRYSVSPGMYFLAVGSLTWRKGSDLLLEAASQLRSRGIDVPILVSGRRHDAGLLKQYEDRFGSEPDFPLRLLGFIPDRDQQVLLSNSIALVFPTRYEGFGIPALEAMAAETAVICSGTSALPEVVGDAALIVEPLSTECLVQRMVEVSSSQDCRKDLIERGRVRAQGFRWENCANRLIEAMKYRT